jgi:hypothetical protein
VSARAARALIPILLAATFAGCGGSGAKQHHGLGPVDLGVDVKLANCSDWKRGSHQARVGTLREVAAFAGGQLGSSAGGARRGALLREGVAYNVMQRWCVNYYARGFKLYKLYVRAAAFLGHEPR